jgi:hypothetical protein
MSNLKHQDHGKDKEEPAVWTVFTFDAAIPATAFDEFNHEPVTSGSQLQLQRQSTFALCAVMLP